MSFRGGYAFASAMPLRVAVGFRTRATPIPSLSSDCDPRPVI